MGNNTVETIIGAIVVVVAAAFLYFAYTTTSAGSLSGYELTARLTRVDGLAVGTDVRLSGIKIGVVDALNLDPKTYLVTLHMNIRKDVPVPDDSSLMVTQSGLLGGNYVSITPGGSDKMLADGGAITNTQGSVGRDGPGRPLHRQWRQQQRRRQAARKVAGMKRLALAGCAAVFAVAAHADPAPGPKSLIMRGLDKITGRAITLVAPLGQPIHFATLTITARYCYSTPAAEPPETAAFVQIYDHRPDQPERRVFSGWMYGSSPGLNGMEHPLYDVWVITCKAVAPGETVAIGPAKPVKPVSPDAGDTEKPTALPADAGQ